MSKRIHSEEDTAKLRAVLGPRLRSARTAMGITQEQAAKLISISAEFYARMERGNALPSAKTLARIADALQVTVDHLIGFDTATLKVSPPVSQSIPKKRARQVSYIIDQARDDPELRRLLMALVKMCERGPDAEPEADEFEPN